MVFPAFNPNSFWNYLATCEAVGAKYPAAPLGLITVAALLPSEWPVRLVNLNTEALDPKDWEWADLVMTGGMLPQQVGTLEVIAEAKRRSKPVVVGGPDATSSPHIYAGADFRVLGEAEEILSEFVSAWRSGSSSGTFEAKGFPDVTRSPIPRFDLLKFDDYLHVGVQYSRGCPFNCEFCDIIELYGRVPRAKTTEQILREIEALHAAGYRGHVDFVDDNLIGNRKALKTFLPELVKWQEAHRWPFEFTTEATVNLADDPELLDMLQAASFFAIFVGIESPDTETLVHMQKRQNTRRVLAESIQKIYRAGIFVNAGFIVGFDTERATVAEAMIECIDATSIPVCMVGLLYALPNTQLTRRLTAEGRLHVGHDHAQDAEASDQCTAGLNFETVRPRIDALRDYRQVLESVYAPASYFARVRAVGRVLDGSKRRFRQTAKHWIRDLRGLGTMIWRLGIRDRRTRREYWKTMFDCLRHNPKAVRYVGAMCALYLHLGPFSRHVTAGLDKKIAGLAVAPKREVTRDAKSPAVAPSPIREAEAAT